MEIEFHIQAFFWQIAVCLVKSFLQFKPFLLSNIDIAFETIFTQHLTEFLDRYLSIYGEL